MRMPASIPNRCPSPTMKTRCHYTCRLGEENCPMYQQLPGIWRAHPSKCFPVTLVTQLSPAFVGRQPQLGGLCEHTVIHVEAQLLECRWEDRKKEPKHEPAQCAQYCVPPVHRRHRWLQIQPGALDEISKLVASIGLCF